LKSTITLLVIGSYVTLFIVMLLFGVEMREVQFITLYIGRFAGVGWKLIVPAFCVVDFVISVKVKLSWLKKHSDI